ncbi:MAG TPA: UvrB/UvrC motif-containing protein [Terriglobales bacterium]|nr:UvrB/UvrC motif-containing protein [Terriglobales bacterium]
MSAQIVEFTPDRDAELFAAAPASAAVFVLRGEEGEPYISKSSNLRRRLQRLLGSSEGQTRKLNLRDRVRSVEWSPAGSDFEASFLLYKILRREFPGSYDQRLRLRFAPLVKLILDNPYPRATVTTRISSVKGKAHYYGPFPTRVAAEKFANDALDLFKLRRCTFDLDPDPAFPGCIYSEMKMCLAPCFQGCTDEQYAAEVERVQQFFQSGGQSLVREIERQRDEASAKLDFEGAAAVHARLDKVKAAIAQFPEIVRRLDELNGVMVQPSAERESVALFKIVAGQICAPVTLAVGKLAEASKPRSMESRIADALQAVEAPKLRGALEWMEHLALLRRWYYRTAKVGELFLAERNGELPMRRVVRGVSRVFRGEKPAGDLSDTAGDYWKFRAREAGLAEN